MLFGWQSVILIIRMGEQWRELRPGVEGQAGAEIVGNKAEGEIGRRLWEVWSMRPGNL